MNHVHLIEPGRRQRQIECGGELVLRLHSRAELPGDNEAREVVEHGGEIVPAPARDLEIGEVEVCQSWLGAVVLSLELLGRFDNDRRPRKLVMRDRALAEADKSEASETKYFPRPSKRTPASSREAEVRVDPAPGRQSDSGTASPGSGSKSDLAVRAIREGLCRSAALISIIPAENDDLGMPSFSSVRRAG